MKSGMGPNDMTDLKAKMLSILKMFSIPVECGKKLHLLN